MTDTTTLAPCPFCGSNQTAAPHDTHRPGCYFLVLASVKASPGADVSWATDLIAAWNRRAPAPASHEAPTTALAAGWATLMITHDGQHAEEVAYGPQIMMDRLRKWLDHYFAMLTTPATVAGQCEDAIELLSRD